MDNLLKQSIENVSEINLLLSRVKNIQMNVNHNN